MKGTRFIPLVVVLALLIAMVGCATPAASPTAVPAAPTKAAAAAPTAAPAAAAPTAAPAAPAAAAPTAAAPVKAAAPTVGAGPSVTLKYVTWTAATIVAGKAQARYLDEVEKRSNGRIKFERYWAAGLVAAADIPDALSSGIGDMGVIWPPYYAGKFPLTEVGTLPGIGGDLWSVAHAMKDTYDTVPAIQQEAAKFNIRYMAPFAASPYGLMSKKEVTSVGQVKGMKIRALGLQAEMVKALEGAAVSIAAPEIFDALSRGTVDGVAASASMSTGYSFQDAAKFFTEFPFGTPVGYMGIRTQTWDKMPKDLQALMTQVADESFEPFHDIYQIQGEEQESKKMQAAGVKFGKLSAAEQTKLGEIAQSAIFDKWTKDMESKKLPGKLVLDTYSKLVNDYMKKSPYNK